MHLYHGSAHMLASRCDHKYFCGVGAELCHRQQPADVKVSGRTGRAMGCGGCAFTRVSCVLRRSWIVSVNIFNLSKNIQANVNELLVRLIQHSSPSHSSIPSALFDIRIPSGPSQRAACDELHAHCCTCSVARTLLPLSLMQRWHRILFTAV